MTGIGGDCFVLAETRRVGRDPRPERLRTRASGLDAAAMRAQGLTPIPIQGIEAVTLPGAIDAFCRLNADYGR